MAFIERSLGSMMARWSESPAQTKLITVAACSASGLVAARMFISYKQWLAMGPGGVPYDVRGWLICKIADIFASQPTRTLDVYSSPDKKIPGWAEATDQERKLAQTTFLKKPLPQRSGPRAKSIPFALPQRERNVGQVSDEHVKKRYLAAFDDLLTSHQADVEWGQSQLERRGKAMFLKPPRASPRFLSSCKREVAHIHGSDLSAHVSLSLPDAEEVVAKGWGERHAMSGGRLIPLQYTMLYVPRNIEEIETFLGIFETGILYYCSGGE